MPGHGRAGADSHEELPVVDAADAELAEDMAPFAKLADAPMAMTAHLLFPAWDAERCATLSPVVIGDVIRGRIGYDGLLMSDDIAMAALSGPIPGRAQAAIAAGCDLVLVGSGRIEDNVAIAGALPAATPAAEARLERAMASIAGMASDQSFEELSAKREALLAYV